MKPMRRIEQDPGAERDVMAAKAPDLWRAGQPYDDFRGRWSRPVAGAFIRWLAPPVLRWLDIGCGTGALTEAILDQAWPAAVVAVDPSAEFLALARRKLADPRITFAVGDALNLPAAAHAVDMAVSGLALNFMPEPAAALRAMQRAVQRDGVIALYVWDYAGKMEMLRCFWDSVAALDPHDRTPDEGVHFPICQPDALTQLFAEAGLRHVEVEGLEITMTFAGFADYWGPFLGGQGPAPGCVAGLGVKERAALEAHLRAALPFPEDGALTLLARAWAVRART